MSVATTQALAEGNLAVGNWTNQKGAKHVSLSRVSGKYHKNIAVPVELVPAVIEAMQAELDKLAAEGVAA